MRSIICTTIILSFIAATWTPATYGQVYDYEKKITLSRNQRDGKDTDDFREVGEAEVTESAYFPDGIHLESREKDTMAVAVYLMALDLESNTLAIQVAYKGSGRIFVRDVSADETTGVGVTFELPADRERMTFHLAAQSYINPEGVVELHAVVTDKQSLDVDYIELEGRRHKPRVKIVERYRYLPEPWHDSSYWYYYTGPVYLMNQPYHYVLYDDWWSGDWYASWRVGIHIRIGHYPIQYYYYASWPLRRYHSYHHYHYRTPSSRNYVTGLPKSRHGVHYKNTGRRRRYASRSRLSAVSPRINTSRTNRQGISQVRRQSTSNPTLKRQRGNEPLTTRRRSDVIQRSNANTVAKQRRYSANRQKSYTTRSSQQRPRANPTIKRRRNSGNSVGFSSRSRPAIRQQESQYRRQTSSRSQNTRSIKSRTYRAPSGPHRSMTKSRSTMSTGRSRSAGATKRKRHR